jgi:hypothetical protein
MRHIVLMLVAAFCSATVQAQEYEMRSEFFFCNLNEGKTMADVVAQSEAYGKFSKDMGTKYAQAIMTPMHAGDTNDYDYILWGTWPDGEAMYKEWGSFANQYGGWSASNSADTPDGEAGDCHRSIAMFNMGVTHNRIPMDERDAKQPIQFAQCSLKEGATMAQLYAQAAANKEKMDEGGFKGWGIHYFFPYLGFEDVDYDFVQMNHWYSYKARGHMANNWGDFVAENPEIASDIQLLVSCSGSNSFVSQMVFNNM